MMGTNGRLSPQRRILLGMAAILLLVFVLSTYLNMTNVSVYHTRIIANESLQRDSRVVVTTPGVTTASLSCHPSQRIVFLKTHKTAGTSLGTILQRYGFTMNLTFAIPAKETPVFQCCRVFRRSDVFQYKQVLAISNNEADFGGQTADFKTKSADSVNHTPGVRKSSEFTNQSSEIGNISTDIGNQSTDFGNNTSSTFGDQATDFRNRSSVFRNQSSDFRNLSSDLVNELNGGFHMLASHAVYSRPEMDAVIPDAFYITSLRNPTDQFESAFVYFDMAKQAGIKVNASTNPLDVFFKNPKQYRRKIRYGISQVQNGQLYDLGFQSKYFSDPFYIKYKIRQLDTEIDLVLIKEYFDESLILMKKLFCWEVDDILYIPKRIRDDSFRYHMSDKLWENIRQWNHADVLLYEHFNRTLWRKIDEYGPKFWRDLDKFRARVQEVTSMCQNGSHVFKDNKHHLNIVRMGEQKTSFCQNLFRSDGEYVSLSRDRMRLRESKASEEIVHVKVSERIVTNQVSTTNEKSNNTKSIVMSKTNHDRANLRRRVIVKKIIRKKKKE